MSRMAGGGVAQNMGGHHGHAPMGVGVGGAPPTGTHPNHPAAGRLPISDFFGKMMSFSSCHQSPMLPTYYQNSMYTPEKVDSHL